MSDVIRNHQKRHGTMRKLTPMENAVNEVSRGQVPEAAYPALRAAGSVIRAVNPKVDGPSGVAGKFRQSGSH
jgi:hypothetical protein